MEREEMSVNIDVRAPRVLFVWIVFGLLVACSTGNGSEPTLTSTEGAAPATASRTPTRESTATATAIPATPTAVPASPTAPLIEIEPGLNDLPDLEALKTAFNQDGGRPRMILLLSTGCPSCLLGARWVDQVLLQQNPDLDLQVYAIWFPTVPENLLAADIDFRWDPEVLTDPRATHFWDPERTASAWLAEHQAYEGPQRSVLSRTVGDLIWGNAIWDAHFLYDSQARWDGDLSGLITAAYPIAHHWDDIRQALGVERPPVAVPAGPVTYRFDRQESLVTYEVSEVFAGEDLNDAIGMTQAITGTLELNAQDPSQSTVGEIRVDISTLRSDNWLRDDRLRNEFLESDRFPLAVFTPTELQGLPGALNPGEGLSFDMIGELEVRETAVPTTFQVTARLEEGWLIGSATTVLEMTDFGFDPPALGAGLVRAENVVDLRIDFVARPEAN